MSVALKNSKTKVFVSYAREDLTVADRIIASLRDAGVEVFRDVDDTLPSEQWWHRIAELVQNSDSVVFVLSARSAESSVCADEVALANSLSKRVFPAAIEAVHWDSVPEGLAKHHSVFLDKDFDTNIKILALALLTDIEWVREKTRLQLRALAWSIKRLPAELLRGRPLEMAEEWRRKHPVGEGDIGTLLTNYLATSRDHATLRTRRWLIGSAAAAVSSTALGGFAMVQRNTAIAERDRALANLSISKAYDSADKDPSQALRHALDAWHQTPNSVDAHLAVLRTYYEAPGFPIRLLRKSEADWTTTNPWFSAAFLPDSNRIISRDLTQPARVLLVDPEGSVNILETVSEIGRLPPVPSPIGDGFIVYEHSRRAIVFYDLGGTEKQAIQSVPVTTLAFSKDGSLFAAGWNDGHKYGVTVYERDGKVAYRFSKLTGSAEDIAFAPNGKALAVAADKSAWIIPLDGSELSKIDHPDYVTGVAYYPGDETEDLLATTCWDGLPRIWWGATGRILKSLKGHTSRTYCPRFSSDGESLASASWDGTTRIWHGRNIVTDAQVSLPGPGATSLVSWSHDDRWLATAESETLTVWNLADRKAQSSLKIEAEIGLSSRDWAADGYNIRGSYRGVELQKDGKQLVQLPAKFVDTIYRGKFSAVGGFVEVEMHGQQSYFPIHPEVIENIVFVSRHFGKVPR